MSDQTNAQNEGGKPDDVAKQLKSEFNRKFQNQEAQLSALAKSNEQLMQMLSGLNERFTSSPKDTVESVSEDLDPLDPDYTDKLERRLEKKFEERQRQNEKTQQQIVGERNRVLSEVAKQYPEVTNNQSELHQKAAAIFEGYTDSEKSNPAALRSAIYQAASELGVVPVSKRKARDDSDEEYTVPSNSRSSGSDEEVSKPGKKGKLSTNTLWTAQLMGLDVEDEEIVKRLEKRAQRKRWSRYE